MRNIRLTIAYDGSAYHGWQVQPEARTVQGTIERALAQLTQGRCRLRAAGRTDAGVHAEGQIANFHTETQLSCERLRRGANALTPSDIDVLMAEDVALGFDSRRDVIGKHYRYALVNGPRLPPLARGRFHHIRKPLDVPAMAAAARRLVGTHDFAAFRAADCERKTTRRTLFRCSVGRVEGGVLHIDVEGTAFLKHMVRVIAGTLIDVGLGRMPVEAMDDLLARGDRREAGLTAPAHGLTLVEVFL